MYVSVCKIRLFYLTIAYEGPDLRGNSRNTIAFADSQTENKPVKEGLINGVVAFTVTAKILALLRLSVNVFQLRITKKLKINFFVSKS